MKTMTAKQKKDLRKIFDNILHELEKAKEWHIDMERDLRDLSIPELIEADLIKDGFAHMKDTGERTVTIKYQIKKGKEGE